MEYPIFDYNAYNFKPPKKEKQKLLGNTVIAAIKVTTVNYTT